MKRGQSITAAVIGATATLLLHSLLFVAAVWGDSAQKSPRLPEVVGAGANAGSPEGTSAERRITVELQPESVLESPLPSELPIALEVPHKVSMLAITGPDALPMAPLTSSDEGEEANASDADMLARTQLAGLYEGQMRARIERAWLRPREPIGEGKFVCRILIRQSDQGVVGEIEVQQCNGSAQWQKSLTDAIFAASPLPAPPNPQVFADSFSMRFEASAFAEGAPLGLYAPDTAAVASVTAPQR